ncbi:MAG TPA: cytochrome c maturation protein CcmE [Nitrospirae bacterium]|nr:cytochrome c-type biogenesis protein CcmE [bacterium BMS3Abin06]HDH10691.1 cytochrome c maturation protein CcmE [Nitrospirota bacterium]HDZ02979.1 cytochrome c maturation protein CcmE [Nitrospirota bacterium]
MRARQKTVLFAVILIAASFIYLMFLGMEEGSMYYLEVSEFFGRLDELGQTKVRINGEIVPGSLNYDTNKMKLEFSLKDINGSQELKVVYNGTPPDLLEEEGVTLVAEGSYNKKRGIFEAKKLLVKCPSKYEKKEEDA